jgi:LacI family transcriptional regulator
MELRGNVEEPGDAAPPAESGNRKPSATIYDVARHLGVSPSTVSRALNKPGRINPKTEQRIREAAAALNYRLNPSARSLQTGRTETIGLILSDITNPVYFTLVRGVEHIAAQAGYTLLLAESQESAEQERETAERLLLSVDGLILVASRLDDETIEAFSERKPLVVINRAVGGVDAIVPDVHPGITQALDHLAHLGHESIAFLSGPAGSWMNRLRWDTLLAEAPARGMNIVEIGPGAPTREGGREALSRVKPSGVTAVITYNDLMAIGLLDACRADGIPVPEGLSIIGFDDIFGSDFTSPPMSTIRSPLGDAGESAARHLIAMADGAEEGLDAVLRTEFVLRGSTSGPRPRRPARA